MPALKHQCTNVNDDGVDKSIKKACRNTNKIYLNLFDNVLNQKLKT